MFVYLFNIVVILLLGQLLIYQNPTEKNRRLYCTVCSSLWILIAGLRGWGVGVDTYNYYLSFEKADNLSWGELFQRIVVSYFRTSDSVLDFMAGIVFKDPGYAVFEKLGYQLCGGNYQLYLLVVAVIMLWPMGYFIYKNSEDPCFSFLLFSTLFYSSFACLARQGIAMSLVVFLGTELIRKRRFFAFLLITLVASTIHKSVLAFFPFYFIATSPVTKTNLMVLAAGLLFMISGGGQLILTIAGWFGFVNKENFISVPLNYIIMMSSIGIAVACFYQKIQERSPEKSMEIHATLIAVAITVLTFFDQGLMRVQIYYAMFMMFSIPSLLKCFTVNPRRICYIAGVGLLVLLFLRQVPYYAFFWEPMILPDAYFR